MTWFDQEGLQVIQLQCYCVQLPEVREKHILPVFYFIFSAFKLPHGYNSCLQFYFLQQNHV